MSEREIQHYDFGEFRLKPAEGKLFRLGKPVPLAPKAFETLLKLVQSAGRILDKESLIREIWPDSFVEENSLTRNISILRKALNDENNPPQFIETLPKRGYRFVSKVGEIFEPATKSPQSIAILPFKTVEDDSDIKYFGLGMADCLITRLSNLRQFIVRPTRAVQKFTGEVDPLEIGEQLQVEAVLDGSIMRFGDDLRVTVQFISVRDRKVLWGEKFDEKITNLLAVQDSIVERAATSLLLKLSAAEQETLHDSTTRNAAAHRFFMLGRYHWNKRSKNNLTKAIDYFRQSITEDKNYALAYVGLADCLIVAPQHHLLSPQTAFPQAKEYAEAALAINENLAEAFASRAHAKFVFDWDWAGAEESYQQAISLKPNYSTARQWYGSFLTARGRFAEAEAEMKQAQFLDPLSPAISRSWGSSLAYAGQLERAVAMYEKTLEFDPNSATTYADLSIAYRWLGKHDEALKLARQAVAISGDDPPILTTLAGCLAAAGDERGALALVTRLVELIENKYVSPFHLALVFVDLNRIDEVFHWLEKAVEWRDICIPYLAVNPEFSRIRADERFAKLLEKTNLTVG